MTVVAPSAPVPREEPSAGENSALLPSVLRVRKIVVRAAGAISAFALLLQLALLTVDVVGRATFGFYFSIVGFCYLFGYGQAEAVAFALVFAGIAAAVEAVKDAVYVCGFDADAMVCYLQHCRVVLLGE